MAPRRTASKFQNIIKKNDCCYAFKVTLVILGVIVLTSVVVTTAYNSYRVYQLQMDMISAKEKFNKEVESLRKEIKNTNEGQNQDIFILNSTIQHQVNISKTERDNLERNMMHINVTLSKLREELAQSLVKNRTINYYADVEPVSYRIKRSPSQNVSNKSKIDMASSLKSVQYIAEDRNKQNYTMETMLADEPFSDMSSQDYPDNTYSHRRQYIRPRNREIESLDERPSIQKMGRIKPLPTVHYSGDTSRYVVGLSDNFNGNGHLRHDTNFMDWKPSTWVDTLNMDQYFSLNNHTVKIKESGLYLIYAQIYYLTYHDSNGFRIYKNNEMIFQCTTTAHSSERKLKGNTCFTAGAEYLSDGDEISLGDIEKGRYTLYEQGKSFFGMVKLGDVKIK